MYDRILDARLIAYHLWPYHFITSISLSPACSTLLAVWQVWQVWARWRCVSLW